MIEKEQLEAYQAEFHRLMAVYREYVAYGISSVFQIPDSEPPQALSRMNLLRMSDTEHTALASVADALREGDIQDCLAPDVAYAAGVLKLVHKLETTQPGLFSLMLVSILDAVRYREKAAVMAKTHVITQQDGTHQQWLESLQALAEKKDVLQTQVAFFMAQNKMDQADAIEAVAAQHGKPVETVKRTVLRSKQRKRQKK